MTQTCRGGKLRLDDHDGVVGRVVVDLHPTDLLLGGSLYDGLREIREEAAHLVVKAGAAKHFCKLGNKCCT